MISIKAIFIILINIIWSKTKHINNHFLADDWDWSMIISPIFLNELFRSFNDGFYGASYSSYRNLLLALDWLYLGASFFIYPEKMGLVAFFY